jgi:DNA polymerase-3 subunit delta
MAKGSNFLFLGPELGEKNDAINAIRANIKKTGGTPPEETRFYAGEKPFSEILSVLLNGSLFADTRLILIKNADAITKKSDIEGLAQYIASPQDDTTLILIADSTKVETGVEKLFSRDNKKVFWEMFEENKERWLVNFFRKEGFTITPDARSTMLQMVENNTLALREECTRIVLFLKTGAGGEHDRTISEELLLKTLSHSKQENVFSLFSALAKGDITRSIESEHSLLAGGDSPQAIFAALASSFRKYRDYCVLRNSGAAINDFELKKLGINFLNKKDFMAAYSIYGDIADICLSLIAEYDIQTRVNFALNDILMDVFIYKIIALKKPPR